MSDSVAVGVFGPDLSKLMMRQTIGAGVAPLNRDTLASWVHDPQILKPGSYMPDMQLNEKEINAVVAYLETLR